MAASAIREARLSCSSSASEVNQDDEYHDDGLPDLVLASKSQDEEEDYEEDNSVVDLILSLAEGRRAVSVSDLASDVSQDSEYLNDQLEETTVHAVPSGATGFKVTYTDHRKAYVPPSKPPSYASQVYLSYLCLMPDEEADKSSAVSSSPEKTSTLGNSLFTPAQRRKFSLKFN